MKPWREGLWEDLDYGMGKPGGNETEKLRIRGGGESLVMPILPPWVCVARGVSK